MEIGNIIRSTAEMRLTATEERRTNSVAMRASNPAAAALAIAVGPAVRVELAELAARDAQEALAVPAVLVARVVLGVRVVLVAQVALVVRAVLVAPVALAEQAVLVGRVALAERAVLVALVELAALATVQAEEQEPETVRAAPVPEHDPLAVLRKTKSAIATHHRGLRLLHAAAEDLGAGVAEIMRAPAATEAATAWVAAE